MRLIWVTDPHFELLHPDAPRLFGEELASQGDGLVVTGDIAEAPLFEDVLQKLAKGFGKPVYFVLGNHDLYGGTFRSVYRRAGTLDGWLRKETVTLTSRAALLGTDGWWDLRVGNPHQLEMDDFKKNRSFAGRSVYDIIEISRKEADDQAQKAYPRLQAAAQQFRSVLFATHIPPFPTNPRDLVWDPWFVQVSMGQILARVAKEFPNTMFTVLCGHRHRPAVYKHFHNLVMYQGGAEYFQPSITNTIEVR